MKKKILVVDDSAFMRQAISSLINNSADFEVVGIARDGIDAIDKAKHLRPDLITMDIMMDKMDGISALKEIMKTNPIPVVMLSEHTAEGAKLTIEALQVGAVECFLKSDILKNAKDEKVMTAFFERLKAAAGAKVNKIRQQVVKNEMPFVSKRVAGVQQFDFVLIGTSTGGPNALNSVLPYLPANFPIPVLVLQHMPKGFTASLAERFNKMCPLRVKEAQDGEVLERGTIYIAPAGYQTLVSRRGGQIVASMENNDRHQALYTPSVDVTMESLVPVFGNKLLTVIMTGMGKDGQRGCELLKQKKGYVISESEETCVVYGMPRAVETSGLSDEVVLLNQIPKRIIDNVIG